MDRRVTLQSKSATRDAMGGEVVTYATFASVWAEKRDLAGREYLTAGQSERAEIQTLWRLRWLSGVTPAMRLIHGSDVYDIESVAELGRNDALELHTKRLAA